MLFSTNYKITIPNLTLFSLEIPLLAWWFIRLPTVSSVLIYRKLVEQRHQMVLGFCYPTRLTGFSASTLSEENYNVILRIEEDHRATDYKNASENAELGGEITPNVRG